MEVIEGAMDPENLKDAEKGWLWDGLPKNGLLAEAINARPDLTPDKLIILRSQQDTICQQRRGMRWDPVEGKYYNLRGEEHISSEIADRLLHLLQDKETTIRERVGTFNAQMEDIGTFRAKATWEVTLLSCPLEAVCGGTPIDLALFSPTNRWTSARERRPSSRNAGKSSPGA